jgi:glycosyltransferase involved in cell wall biosynthesis
MKTLGLSMVVKNEEETLPSCLKSIHDLFDNIVIIDTGSTDKTIEILKDTFDIDAISRKSNPDDPESITEARNFSLEKNTADWILVLDADETIMRNDVKKIKELIQNATEKAFFLTWSNERAEKQFDDYKMVLFQNNLNIQFDGKVHSNTQISLRRLGLEAGNAQDIKIRHSLDAIKPHRLHRRQRLERYIKDDPDCWRYQWFLGYSYFMEKDFDSAMPFLRDTCNSLSTTFPVECLNAHMVLTDLNARKGIHDKCFRIMKQAVTFYESVKDDFEVRANKDMKAWIYNTKQLIDENRLDDIHVYEFAC